MVMSPTTISEGITVRDDEKPRLVRSLGDKSYLILRNHGLLVCGRDSAGGVPANVDYRARLPDPARRTGDGPTTD